MNDQHIRPKSTTSAGALYLTSRSADSDPVESLPLVCRNLSRRKHFLWNKKGITLLLFLIFGHNACSLAELPCHPSDPACSPMGALLLTAGQPGTTRPLIIYVTNPLPYAGSHQSLFPGAPHAPGAADLECTNNAPASLLGLQFKALLSDGTNRIGSATPNVGDGQVDWPLAPNANYFRSDRTTLIGMTDDRGFLSIPLVNPISESTNTYSTGLKDDWTSHPTANCSGWTSSAGNGNTGKSDQVDSRVYASGAASCSLTGSHRLLCIEQP